MAFAKFKDELPINIGRQVTILERIGQVDGKFGPQWQYKLSCDGKTFTHWATENEEASLSAFSQGETLQVFKRNGSRPGTYWLEWTPVDGAEARAAANPQVRSNTAQTKADKDYEQKQEEKELKDIEISLQGFAQAFIIQGADTDLAMARAAVARDCLKRKAKAIQLGIPPAPEPSVDPSSLPF